MDIAAIDRQGLLRLGTALLGAVIGGAVCAQDGLFDFQQPVVFELGAIASDAAVFSESPGSPPDSFAIIHPGANATTVLTPAGDGFFAAGDLLDLPGSPTAIVSADLDGDGDDDAALVLASSKRLIFLENNAGTLSVIRAHQLNSPPTAAVAGDLNGDGVMDLAVTLPAISRVEVLHGNSEEAFSYTSFAQFNFGSTPAGVACGDFNDDGQLDLAVSNEFASTVTIGLATTVHTYAIQPSLAVGRRPRGITAARVNRDELDDLLVSNTSTGTISYLRNEGGTFAAQQQLPAGVQPTRVITVDIDRDLNMDLAVALSGEAAAVTLRQSTDGTFAYQKYTLPERGAAIAAIDANGDDAFDLVVTAQAASNAMLLINATPSAGPRCLGDTDGNLFINITDFVNVLSNIGTTGDDLPTDVNLDGVVDAADFITVLMNFGNTCGES
ncbi:MAG: FG-GAP-like repeat-containing protein [Planctomycetota bacterium]